MAAATDLHVRIHQERGIRIEAAFSCRAGEFLAVVGPSGGGKTTLLRMIAGLAKPESGEIRCGDDVWFDDQQHIHASPQARHIGFVPQHFGLFPKLSALGNIIAGLDHLPKAERMPRALAALEKVNLHGLTDRLPGELSGGQKQRVALARALAREPRVLLLDEPFSAVDRETRERLYLELARLKAELNIPVIMVTHDLNEALLLADSMLLISQGQMLQHGAPQEVFARPRTEAVARQMGLRNIFDAHVVAQDEQKGVTWLKFGERLIASDSLPDVSIGQKVRWVIPNQGIRFNSIASGRLCRSFNILHIRIETLLTLGESVRLEATVLGSGERLNTEIPLHLARKLAITAGVETEVALKSDQLHLLEMIKA